MVRFLRVWQWGPVFEFFHQRSNIKHVRLLRMEYQEAVCTLNALQSSSSVPEQLQQQSGRPELQLQAARVFLQRAGIMVEELDRLNAIHVAGTKGKDAHGGTMPGYFLFLTILAFRVFLQEKPGVPAFTVMQPGGSMAVLKDRAKEIKVTLTSSALEYQVPTGSLHLGLVGQHQHSNASLALQLSWSWLQHRHLPEKPPPAAESAVLSQAPAFVPSPHMMTGLEDTEWPGRAQTLRHGPVTYCLDGAHTTHSMQACVQWFREQERVAMAPMIRVLLFNATGERDCTALLKPLIDCRFDFAVFCPNILDTVISSYADQHSSRVTAKNMLTRCLSNQKSWRRLSEQEEKHGDGPLTGGRLPLVAKERTDTLVFPCMLSALLWITQGRDPVLASQVKRFLPMQPSVQARAAPLRGAASIQVLVTGSLHLVGGVLKHLDPSLAM
ncbi:hypothetical protein AAFF_G00130220 [Aldrovandia affinis]|uniref:tetrahydrofolate synthase n=1 Tax=Aldrovandia affinis TaxID=143900 RepID=A0AAD7RR17_9TELE|nr:hypothetical protein AAFF_G00130220 [Aldrovandia affinis]